jgi:hypothetical protein
MKRNGILAAIAAVALGWATVASADTIQFDPTGTTGSGGDLTIDLLDASPGNSITLGVTASSPATTPAPILFQANLSVAKLGTTVQFANGDGDNYFKFVAGLPGIVTSNSGGEFPTLTFGYNPAGGPNFYNVYANDTPGDDLSGICFSCGTLILSGIWLDDADFFANFTANLRAGVVPLDQFNTDNYPATDTVTGGGAFAGNIDVVFAHPDYFPGLDPDATLFVASSKETLPYTQVDPSACFLECAQPGVASVGAVNGVSGPNTMLETDASFSFEAEQDQVPEPASLALFGFGLLACAGLRRRQMRKAS